MSGSFKQQGHAEEDFQSIVRKCPLSEGLSPVVFQANSDSKPTQMIFQNYSTWWRWNVSTEVLVNNLAFCKLESLLIDVSLQVLIVVFRASKNINVDGIWLPTPIVRLSPKKVVDWREQESNRPQSNKQNIVFWPNKWMDTGIPCSSLKTIRGIQEITNYLQSWSLVKHLPS